MRTIALLVAVALAPLLTSCQTSGGSISTSQSYVPPETPARVVTTPSPFHPSGPLISARYVPPDRYYGFGGGYRPTYATAAGAADDNNFLYDSDRCCWRHRHGGSYCGYGSYCRSYASNYCSSGYGRSGGYYYPGYRW